MKTAAALIGLAIAVTAPAAALAHRLYIPAVQHHAEWQIEADVQATHDAYGLDPAGNVGVCTRRGDHYVSCPLVLDSSHDDAGVTTATRCTAAFIARARPRSLSVAFEHTDWACATVSVTVDPDSGLSPELVAQVLAAN